jgi:RecB family exonuclease
MKLPVISPTQISTWRLCHRKFAFTYLMDLPRPESTKAQRIGTAVHTRAERFFQTGEPDYRVPDTTPEGEVEATAARILPHIVDKLPLGAASEQKVQVTLGGVLFGGRFDWLHSREDGTVELGDLKTTSNLKYAKTEAELSVDPQALVYSQGQTLVPPDRVDCRWVYVQTRGFPYVREVSFRPDFTALPDLVTDGQAIVLAWASKADGVPVDQQAFEPNTSACDAYGGCPFRAKCQIDPGERLISLQKRMGLLSNTGTGEQDMTQQTFEEMMAAANGIADEPAINPPAPPMAAVMRTEEKENLPPVLDPVQAEAPKAKRVRKPKDTDPAPALDPALLQALSGREKPIGTLCLSTVPRGTNVQYYDLDVIVANVRAEIVAKCGVEDYRLIDFGKGAGILTALVEEKIRALRPDVLVVYPSAEGRLLAGPLSAMAEVTFQGL